MQRTVPAQRTAPAKKILGGGLPKTGVSAIPPKVSAGSAKLLEQKRLAEEKAKRDEEERAAMAAKIKALEEKAAKLESAVETHAARELEHKKTQLDLRAALLTIEERDRAIAELKLSSERSHHSYQKVTEELLDAGKRKNAAEVEAARLRAEVAAMQVSLDTTTRALEDLRRERGTVAAIAPTQSHVLQTPSVARGTASLFGGATVSRPPAPQTDARHVPVPQTDARRGSGSVAYQFGSEEFFTRCMSPGFVSVFNQVKKAIADKANQEGASLATPEEKEGTATKDGVSQVSLLKDFLAELLKVYVNLVDYPTLTTANLIDVVKKGNVKFSALDFKPARDEDRLTYLQSKFSGATHDALVKTLCRTIQDAYTKGYILLGGSSAHAEEFRTLPEKLKRAAAEKEQAKLLESHQTRQTGV